MNGSASGRTKLIARGVGPTLAAHGVTAPLLDPILEIRDAQGSLLAANNDWQETQAFQVLASTLAPSSPLESAAIMSLGPGNYTTVLHGASGTTGIALLEIYRLD